MHDLLFPTSRYSLAVACRGARDVGICDDRYDNIGYEVSRAVINGVFTFCRATMEPSAFVNRNNEAFPAV